MDERILPSWVARPVALEVGAISWASIIDALRDYRDGNEAEAEAGVRFAAAALAIIVVSGGIVVGRMADAAADEIREYIQTTSYEDGLSKALEVLARYRVEFVIVGDTAHGTCRYDTGDYDF